MENYLEKLKNITKFYGVVLLTGAALLGSLGVLAFLLTVLLSFFSYSKSNIVSAFEKKSPSIEFYASDYFPDDEEKLKKSGSVRPKEENELAAEKIIVKMLPRYTAVLQEYMKSSQDAAVYSDEDEKKSRIEKDQEELAKIVARFEKGSLQNIKENLGQISKLDYRAYGDGLIDYLENAEKAGVEVYTINKNPIQVLSLYGSKPYRVYHSEFISMKEKMEGTLTTGQSIKDIFNSLKTELLYLYLGLFGVFSTMVLILVMNRWALARK